jgi:hypothetical protein
MNLLINVYLSNPLIRLYKDQNAPSAKARSIGIAPKTSSFIKYRGRTRAEAIE